MTLIADSGSTKTLWRILPENTDTNNTTLEDITTKGINPFFQTEKEISASIESELITKIEPTHIKDIYFYGAGCANEEKNNIVKAALSQYFAKARIFIYSDMFGAARGLLQENQGIACILGTGSNSCLYDGKKIMANVSAGGFILGDEGSGAVIGKLIISDYIKNQMPIHLQEAIELEYKISPAIVIDSVYKKNFPNRYLAQFTHFASKHIEDKYIQTLIYTCFANFFERNIKQYNNWEKLSINFVGSIAFHFSAILKKAAIDCNCKVGNIVISPIDGLMNFHQKGKQE